MYMDETLKASEARKQWKELLDRAVAGEVIKIERGGTIFYLSTAEGMVGGMNRVVDSALTLGAEIAKHKARNPTPPQREEWNENTETVTVNLVEKNNSEAKASNSTDGFVEAGVDPSGELHCCKAAKPCKHWQWDGNIVAWVNSLSGRSKEA